MTAIRTAQDIKLKPRTTDVLIEENLEFRGLLLSAPVQEGLTKCGFVRPSPIQLKAIPLGRCGLDLIVQAKSGTGKTCVFAVIALEGLLLDTVATQVLVLAPTREIAAQVCEVVNNIGTCMPGLRCLTFIGGTPLAEDRQKLSVCHIAIGTPGRIKQLIEEKVLCTSSIRLFVLDEADKLLEYSFQEQVNWIFSTLPENKQMLALSATYPERLAQHLTAYMRNPVYLRLNIKDIALLGIRQYYRSVDFSPLANKLFDTKTEALLELISSIEFHQCLIFSNYQMRAESLAEVLKFHGWAATYISGSREQEERMAAMASLKQMTCRVLICTDLISRGIDAENVNLVINLDLPLNHETYLHRIGRAGRFGTYGAAVSFVSEGKETEELHKLEKRCNTKIKPLPDPVPRDLAHSSGFVSLEHLVTTETIITRKENGGKILTEPLKASQITLQPTSNSSDPIKYIATELTLPSNTNGKSKCESDNVETSKISVSTSSVDPAASQISVQVEVKEKPKRKTNNVWTSLSYSYGEEAKDIEDKRAMGKQVSASAKDQLRNESSQRTASPTKRCDKENCKNVANVFDSTVQSPLKRNTSTNISGKQGESMKSNRPRPTPSIASSGRGSEGSFSKLRTYAELLADYDKYIAADNCELVDSTKASNVQDTTVTNYEEYLNSVSEILQGLIAQNIKIQRSQESTVVEISEPSDSTKIIDEPVAPLKGSILESTTQTVENFHQKKADLTDENQNKHKGPLFITTEEMVQNYTALNKRRIAHTKPETTKLMNRSDTKDEARSPVKLSPISTTAKTKSTKHTKASPYGAWQPYMPPPSPHTTEDLEAEAGYNEASNNDKYEYDQDFSESDSESDSDSDWDSNSLQSTDVEELRYAAQKHHRSTKLGSGYIDGQSTAQNYQGTTHNPPKYGEPGYYPQHAEEQWYNYPKTQQKYATNPNEPCSSSHKVHGYYPTPGTPYDPYPPEAGSGDYSAAWGKHAPMHMAFQNMMQAQQSMMFTSMCYFQYSMHLQQAEFYRRMLKSQQAFNNTGNMQNMQERYIRKMSKWMSKCYK